MIRAAGSLCLLLALAGCREARDLVPLTLALNREFQDAQVGVQLTDGFILTVTMTDSPLLTAPCDSQAAVAIRVASFVRDHYGSFDSLQIINVAFATRGSREAPGAQAGLPFRFARENVARGLTSTDSARVVESCRNFRELQ